MCMGKKEGDSSILQEVYILRSDYHVVLPILDGHANSDRAFTSIEDNAAELTAYIVINAGKRRMKKGQKNK